MINTEIFKQSWNILEGKWTNVISFIIVYYVIQLVSEEIILFFSNDDFLQRVKFSIIRLNKNN